MLLLFNNYAKLWDNFILLQILRSYKKNMSQVTYHTAAKFVVGNLLCEKAVSQGYVRNKVDVIPLACEGASTAKSIHFLTPKIKS